MERSLARRVSSVALGAPAPEELSIRLAALHEMGAPTAQSCAAPQPVLTHSNLRESASTGYTYPAVHENPPARSIAGLHCSFCDRMRSLPFSLRRQANLWNRSPTLG